MKNTFYRVDTISTGEMSRIVEKMHCDLNELINGNPAKEEVYDYCRKLIIDSKSEKGRTEYAFWAVSEADGMPNDARVDFLFMPTYLAVGIMMKSMVRFPEICLDVVDYEPVLKKAMLASTLRGFQGHGYDGLSGLLDCMEILIRSDAADFIDKHPMLCPVFNRQFEASLKFLQDSLSAGPIKGEWGEDYTDRTKELLEWVTGE